MAQYHFAAKIISRSRGQSAVASAAYRAGERMDDDRLGKTFDYRRHLGVVHTEILAPDNAPDWMRDRAQLWNAVEKAEKRKDSQLARSLDIALPYELSLEQNLELLRGFVQEQWVSRGMIADIAIHLPGRTGDIRNVHAHIALTTREITGSGFGQKERDWNTKQELLEWRKAWADHANRILEREGFEERIDHRSLVDQGIDREPTTHVGPGGKEMEKRGVPSDRARKNRDAMAANDDMALLKGELADSEKRLADLKRQLAAERIEQIQAILPKLSEPARTVFTVAAFTGLRESELRGLRWEDYNGEELSVRRSVWRTHVGPTKTEASGENPVPLIPLVKTALDAHRKLHGGDGYIFAGERRGTPLHLDNLSRRVISPALDGGWKGWHGFRRGLASNLYRLGVPPKVIQDILRHADVSTTQTNYIVVDRSETKAAMRKLERAVGKEWAKAKKALKSKRSVLNQLQTQTG